MAPQLKILGISGSNRKNSCNLAILHFIADHFKDEVALEIYNGIDGLPHFNPDLDTDKNRPAGVNQLRNKIDQADAVIIATPEYVFSLPGCLKNALEWCVSTTVFSGKAVGIIVAAASGDKAFESLDLVMTTIEAEIPAGGKLLIKGANGKINPIEGVKDQTTKDQIYRFMKNLIDVLPE